MMEWYQLISYSLTNGIRIFVCMLTITTLLKSYGIEKSAIWLSLICGMVTAVLYLSPIPQIAITALEIMAILCILHFQYNCELRMTAFLAFFFEIAAALWDFILSAGFEMLFRYSMLDSVINGYMVSVWMVRILMIGFMPFIVIQGDKAGKTLNRLISIVAVAGMFCVLILTEQSVIPLSDNQLMTWIILSVILLMAVLIYRVNRQYKMEKTIAQLEKEKNELLERDYQTLSDTYAANAKLFHDFHNHIDVIHRYVSKGNTAEAIAYLENLYTPVRLITQTRWIGDEAVDYLLNSKFTRAASHNIQVNTNIEFPRHTNIRSVDLAAVLGNLLDNSLEAIERAEDSLRFINLTIRRINDMLVIKVENGCSDAPAVTDEELQTSKKDKALHGWGLRSVRSVAERYDGTIETEYNDHTFRAVVTLSFEAVKT